VIASLVECAFDDASRPSARTQEQAKRRVAVAQRPKRLRYPGISLSIFSSREVSFRRNLTLTLPPTRLWTTCLIPGCLLLYTSRGRSARDTVNLPLIGFIGPDSKTQTLIVIDISPKVSSTK
jgi:hypothetical protein